MEEYNHKKIEEKWQNRWTEENIFEHQDGKVEKKHFYILDMFPYPSGQGLHMGHTESYVASDIFYRFKKMSGYDVLHPQGFDSFGLPAENYAIKTGIHPRETTKTNSQNYLQQMKILGLGHDLKNLIYTSDPDYYHWTQFLFGKFFENNLVERKVDNINWCPSCQTGIANEQVENGKCERCKTNIEQKEIPGWFFKIKDFAEDLLWTEKNKHIDWPEHTKKNQNAWIGKSRGAEIEFKTSGFRFGPEDKIKVFTTRPDTIFGATYLVLAPENPLVEKWRLEIENYEEVEEYIKISKNKTELERLENKKKTGIELKGIRAVNPANGRGLPIFIADYVLIGYGTGAIMAVPAHDERDNDFAIKFKLKNIKVIENDILINSGEFNGLSSIEAWEKIVDFLGAKVVDNYRLRNWSISRQRYWGCPIPIVYSPEGEARFVGEENLPWLLPNDVDFVPEGTAPLAKSKELKERVEKIFGKGWKPEVDTMDTFVDSSWYFLRYPDTKNEKEFCSEEKLKKWFPVDLYIGGAEHTYLHLLYTRFFIKALNRMGLIDFDEPFLKLRHQGMVLDKEGVKMSKSKGNVVNPNEMIERFGADAVRTYVMFSAPLEEDVIWNEDNVVGVYRFLEKVWFLRQKVSDQENLSLKKELHKTIKRVTRQVEELKLNTVISDLMKFINLANKENHIQEHDYYDFLKLLSPFAPHITDELAGKILLNEKWPEWDETLAKDEEVIIPIQINGKRRGEVKVPVDVSEVEIMEKVKIMPEMEKWLLGEIVKVIFVPQKILNIVVKN